MENVSTLDNARLIEMLCSFGASDKLRQSFAKQPRKILLAIIAAFLLIEALGLCNTFGQLTLA